MTDEIIAGEPSAAADEPPRTRGAAFEWLASRQWAIEEAWLRLLAEVVAERGPPPGGYGPQGGEGPQAVAARLGRPLQNTRETTVREGVALVPVVGPLFRRANLFTEVSGATSLEVLARDITTALDDPAVRALVLDLDSPGGELNGVNAVATMVREARGRKPVVAMVSNFAASGAFWVASAADRVVLDPTSEVGSIGVVAVFRDRRALDERRGVRTVEIVSSQSPAKRQDPLDDEGRAAIQRRVDALAEVFVEAVARNRGVSRESVLADFGRGGMVPAGEAVAAGMADGLGTLEGVLGELAAPASTPASALEPGFVPQGGASMTTEHESPEAGIAREQVTAAFVAAEFPEVAEALRAEGREGAEARVREEARTAGYEEGLAAGAEAERERILALEAAALPGHERLLETAKADGETRAEDLALKIVAAEKNKGATHLQALQRDAAGLPAVEPSADAQQATGTDPDAPIDERAKAAWDGSAEVREEFRTFEAYLAFRKAEEAGQVRRLART